MRTPAVLLASRASRLGDEPRALRRGRIFSGAAVPSGPEGALNHALLSAMNAAFVNKEPEYDHSN
jgi:hypothetical protein